MTKHSDAVAFLRVLGLADDLDSFTGRKRIQKTIYLLKQFGADLRFGYAWYLHGPYSSELTRTLFNPTDADLASRRELTRAELRITNQMRNFLGKDLYSVDSLELIVSLIYIIKHGPKEGYNTKEKIIRYLQHQKPQFSDEEIETAWHKIETSGIWNRFLARL
jgi:uncharacterized protein YwgA